MEADQSARAPAKVAPWKAIPLSAAYEHSTALLGKEGNAGGAVAGLVGPKEDVEAFSVAIGQNKRTSWDWATTADSALDAVETGEAQPLTPAVVDDLVARYLPGLSVCLSHGDKEGMKRIFEHMQWLMSTTHEEYPYAVDEAMLHLASEAALATVVSGDSLRSFSAVNWIKAETKGIKVATVRALVVTTGRSGVLGDLSDLQMLVVAKRHEPSWVWRGPKQMCYALPGGKVDAGEGPLEACVRELQEETGMDVLSIGKAVVVEAVPIKYVTQQARKPQPLGFVMYVPHDALDQVIVPGNRGLERNGFAQWVPLRILRELGRSRDGEFIHGNIVETMVHQWDKVVPHIIRHSGLVLAAAAHDSA